MYENVFVPIELCEGGIVGVMFGTPFIAYLCSKRLPATFSNLAGNSLGCSIFYCEICTDLKNQWIQFTRGGGVADPQTKTQ